MRESAHRLQHPGVKLAEELAPQAGSLGDRRVDPVAQFARRPPPHRDHLGIDQLIDDQIDRAVGKRPHLRRRQRERITLKPDALVKPDRS